MLKMPASYVNRDRNASSTKTYSIFVAAIVIVSACGGHDVQPARIHQAVVGDSEPLPVPTDTIVPPDAVDHVVVGSIPGSSEVTSDGQAHYTIPILVPPGRRGMQPDIALQYESGAPNGIAGVGWMLTGFSQITFCQHIYATDRYAGWGPTSAYCLDGQRLMKMTSDGKSTLSDL